MGEPLYWHCRSCGAHEAVEATEPPYVIGDKEKCIDCGVAFAEVMTIRDAARIEQALALCDTPRERIAEQLGDTRADEIVAERAAQETRR